MPLWRSCCTFLQRAHILGEIGDAHFRGFGLVRVHGSQKRLPHWHVSLAFGSLASANVQDLRDMFRWEHPVVILGEQSQVGG